MCTRRTSSPGTPPAAGWPSCQPPRAPSTSAATALHGQLAGLYPGLSSRALWGMIGVTQMQGIDDFGTEETFTTAQAPAFAIWALSRGLGEISVWALQRDNGNCPGTKVAGSCSGVAQPTWYFSHVFEPFSYLP